jgi:glycosyltransferase involved in cell wall biosynthesis
VALGHDVTLFASGDSNTSARLVPVWPRALRLGRPRTDPMVPLTHLLETVGRAARDFDVIHCHIDWVPLPLLSRLGVPFLTTTHGRLDLPGQGDLAAAFPMRPTSRSRTTSACRLVKRTGLARSITAFP